MQKQIEVNQRSVEYTLRKTRRAKRMRLVVYCGGGVVVTAPRWMGQGVIERLIHSKAQWLVDSIEHFKQFPPEPTAAQRKAEYLKHKDAALTVATERIAHFNQHYGFVFNQIAIKDQKTRWGSCSRKGNLNFNYKIALLPRALRDYLVVHELCHLGEFNHSKTFWDLVAMTIPNYIQYRRALKKISLNSSL